MDVILTGDNDFLESDIEQPLIFSPGMMIDYLNFLILPAEKASVKKMYESVKVVLERLNWIVNYGKSCGHRDRAWGNPESWRMYMEAVVSDQMQ